MIALLLAAVAWAGACCVGSTSAAPTRAGPCEHVVAGVDLRAEASVGRWDAAGALRDSSLAERSGVATLGAAWRWDRRGQIGLTVPVWLTYKAADALAGWGGGPGDLRVAASWDALPEGSHGGPVLSAGIRVPTGRSWREAHGHLLEDVTGQPGAAALAGAAWERTLGSVPWSVGLGAELGEDPVVTAGVGVGRYLGSRWTVLATLRHTQTWAGAPAARTTAGARLIAGRRLAWRAWLGFEADLPVPLLGWSSMRSIAASGGVAAVR